jgi:hypothetical protein
VGGVAGVGGREESSLVPTRGAGEAWGFTPVRPAHDSPWLFRGGLRAAGHLV